jgi:hypothetical protein
VGAEVGGDGRVLIGLVAMFAVVVVVDAGARTTKTRTRTRTTTKTAGCTRMKT